MTNGTVTRTIASAVAPVIPITALPNLRHGFRSPSASYQSSEKHRTVRFTRGKLNNDENIMKSLKRTPNYRKETSERNSFAPLWKDCISFKPR